MEIIHHFACLVSWARAESVLREALELSELDEATINKAQSLVTTTNDKNNIICALIAVLKNKHLSIKTIVPPPARSLVGSVPTQDVELVVNLDKGVNRGFSLFYIKSRRKLGYVLCRFIEPSILTIRGAAVTESARGLGISRYLLTGVLALAKVLGLEMVTTDFIDKPLLALALESVGFIPDKATFRILLIPDPLASRSDACLIWPYFEDNHNNQRDADKEADLQTTIKKNLGILHSVFSNRFCKSQQFRIASPSELPSPNAKLVTLQTSFTFDLSSDLLLSSSSLCSEFYFRSARLLAILGHILPSSCFEDAAFCLLSSKQQIQ